MTDFTTHHAARIDQAHDRVAAVEKRVSNLEVEGAVSAERFRHIQDALDSIRTSISRAAWIVITAVIGTAVTFILSGGLNVGP